MQGDMIQGAVLKVTRMTTRGYRFTGDMIQGGSAIGDVSDEDKICM